MRGRSRTTNEGAEWLLDPMDADQLSVPTGITGPVGAPVGEPPVGSTDTASFAPARSRPACAAAALTVLT